METRRRRMERMALFLEEVWTRGDIQASDRYIAERYTIRHDPGDPWHGMTLDRAGYKDRVRRSRAAMPDQRFDVQEMFVDNGAVIVTWFWQGTHSGEMAGFRPTGNLIRMSGMTIYYFDTQDRLTGHWQMTDRLGVFQQLMATRAAA